MELQHLNVKLVVKEPEEGALEALIPLFHNWIEKQELQELLLDVADYRHVHAGPGVVLVGHQANYSVDHTDERWGVRYNRKVVVNGGNQDRLQQAMRAAATVCQRLEAEPRLKGKIRFDGQQMELFVNDRLLAPHSDSTGEALRPEFDAFFEKLFRGSEYLLISTGDPRKPFGVSVKSSRTFSTADLLANLST
jgi:hypothetical protein